MADRAHDVKAGAHEYRARVVRWLRLLGLTLCFGGAATLHRWSLEGDPRFYDFLQTRCGQALGSAFGWWSSPLEAPVRDKPVERFSAAEQAALRDIVAGRMGNTSPDTLERMTSYRDVRFRLDFPSLSPRLHPPYLVMSDAPAAETALLVGELRQLHRQFKSVFKDLAVPSQRKAFIHVLYFARASDYSAYQEHALQGEEDTAGFYSPAANRLVLYRTPGADAVHEGHAALSPLLAATVRHEGAHQLFFEFGIHSRHRIENDWLVEGLATYCEEAQIGEVSAYRLDILQRAASLEETLPMASLVDLRSARGLLAYRAAELAYSQSWSLVHLLMTDPYRERFFAYIRQIRDPAQYPHIRRQRPLDLLCRHLDLTPDELVRRWEEHVRQLAGSLQ